MAVYRSFLLLTFASCALSEGVKLFEPCYKNDIKCLSKATQEFLEKTCNGIPKHDIKPLDPLIIPELNVVVDSTMGLAFEFKNINVTGLKNQQISDFHMLTENLSLIRVLSSSANWIVTMDTDKKSVVLKTKAVLNIAGDLKITFTKKNKVFNGAYTASATALGSSQYGYSLTMKDGEEYFVVGPEINTCEIIGEPVVDISDVLQDALNNDSDARDMKPDYETNKVSLRKKTLCRIVETAYITVIHNIRASAKIFPKSAFFKDI